MVRNDQLLFYIGKLPIPILSFANDQLCFFIFSSHSHVGDDIHFRNYGMSHVKISFDPSKHGYGF